MSDSEKNERPENGEGRLQESARNGGEEAAAEAPEAGPQEALEAEVAALKDQLLRALAETENVRNRMRREREEALRYASVALVRDLLPVADNLRRALESLPPGALETDQRLATLVAGVEMTERALQDAFAKHQIRRIDALGEKLDPHRHEAMVEVEDPSRPAGTVSQVFEVGYQLHDRLIRPARVAVARGGPAGEDAGPQASRPGGRVDTEA